MGEIQKVAVIGAGTMGSGIAHVFARSGVQVMLCDVEQRFLDRALASIKTNLGREASKGKLPESEIEPTLSRIHTTVEIESLTGAEIAVEAAPERLELKSEVFRALDRILPSTAILATNTSSISITKMAALTRRACASHRYAFLQPRSRYGSGGSRPRNGDKRRNLRRGARLILQTGQDACRSQRCSRLRLQPRLDASDQ